VLRVIVLHTILEVCEGYSGGGTAVEATYLVLATMNFFSLSILFSLSCPSIHA